MPMQAVPSRRTIVVLGVLLGAMTLASLVLLAFEPGPSRRIHPIRLAAVDRPGDSASRLFATQTAIRPQRWAGVRVHFSGSPYDSPASLTRLHVRAGLSELGYHFVIGNGVGAPEGQVHVGPRWNRQTPGITAVLQPGDRLARDVVDVCLIGDGRAEAPTADQMRMLLWLVHQLQARLDLPPQQIVVAPAEPDSARMFPHARFRQQLLIYSDR